MKLLKIVALSALLLLAACGPADVQTAAEDAASAAGISASDVAAAASAVGVTESDAAAAASDAAAALNDSSVQAAAGEAAVAIEGLIGSEPLRLQNDQPLVLSTTQEIAGVTNYKWTISEVPAGAESARGLVIQENSNGKLTIEPADYAKYFPASGNYTIDLQLTMSDGSTQVVPIPVVVP